MKKLLALALALMMMMTICLVSCTPDDPETPVEDPDDVIDPNTQNNNTNNNNNNENNNNNQNNQNQNQNNQNQNQNQNQNTGWIACATNVYSLADDLNVRATASDKGTKLGKVNMGDELVAKETNGDWYKVTYNGVDAYVKALYVTTNKSDVTFTALSASETLVIKEHKESEDPYTVAARVLPVFDSSISAYDITRENTVDGQLKKVAVNEAGNIWKVEYTKDGVATTYYIGNLAFQYFEGYNAGTGGVG